MDHKNSLLNEYDFQVTLLILIRRYSPQDKTEHVIRKAIKDIDTEKYDREQKEHLVNVIPDMIQGYIKKQNNIYYIAKDEDGIKGLAGINRDEGRISGIFVLPEKQSLGIGSKLLKRLEKKAIKEDIKEIETYASLGSVDFYRKNGYKVMEEKEHEIQGNDIKVKIMRKHLTQKN